MIRRPPGSTRTDTLFPYTTLFRSSSEGKLAYLQSEQPDGPDRILAFDPATGERTPLLRDEAVDPARVLYAVDGSTPIGAMYRGEQAVEIGEQDVRGLGELHGKAGVQQEIGRAHV